MNINLEKAQQEFIKYTEKYDLENERIKAKQEHSLRVMEISKQIAERMKLSNEEVELAAMIGILHDIARFEQYTRYGTYKDLASFDHGDVGAEILQKELRKYVETFEYDEIILKAVKNHNKFAIEKGLTEKELLFAKIIRDADKIDILYQGVVRHWNGREQEVENSIISEDVIQQIKMFSQTKSKIEETPIDNIMRVIAFIFDLNFAPSFEILKENNYINRILDRYSFKDEYTSAMVEEIRKLVNEYIDNKMEINIFNAIKEFDKYVENYDSNDAQIKLKINHIKRVLGIARRIAKSLNLSEADIKLAELIGLLHDIGRFEQVRLYHTFMDKNSIDHAEFGVKILFQDGLIRKFIETDKYDEIIKKAILNHNKLEIEEGLTDREMLHAQIIRDADKADIYYVLTTDSKKVLWGKDDLSEEKISDEIYRQFKEEKGMDYKDIKTGLDLLVCHFKYAFDLNFKETKQIIKENKYIDKLYNRFTFKDETTLNRYNEIYRDVKAFID